MPILSVTNLETHLSRKKIEKGDLDALLTSSVQEIARRRTVWGGLVCEVSARVFH